MRTSAAWFKFILILHSQLNVNKVLSFVRFTLLWKLMLFAL